MARVFHIPGVFFLFAAFVLLFLVSISLPYLPALDFARVHFGGNSAAGDVDTVTNLRFGSWGYCTYDSSGHRTCSAARNAYAVTVFNGQDRNTFVTIGPSWTRGLAVHPVAAGVTLIAFLLSLSTHLTFTLLASLASFLASLIALVAFAIDIALFAFVKHEMNKLSNTQAHTVPSAAFWMTFVSFILLFLAGSTVCFGRRRDRMAGSTSYPLTNKTSWRERFRFRRA
ncbi:pali-domain-containing protein [Abortiporus biennis]|nr:pali-domain-containing protein [Abortiporus biennis]